MLQPGATAPEAPALDEAAQAAIAAKLDAFGNSLAKLRKDAIDGRKASGIETEWLEDEEQYEGIDDSNRGEMAAWRTKPPGQTTDPTGKQGATTSTVFVNITRPYTDAASARVSDMLLPTDDRAWAIKPTPVPDLINMAQGKFPQGMVQGVQQATAGNQADAQQKLQAMAQAAQAVMQQAKAAAEQAQTRIEDWHIECQYHAEMREVIHDCSKTGTGILKGPIPEKRKQVAYKEGALIIEEDIKPASRRVSYWNLYPDPACGENIHNGSHIWEKDEITEKQLLALKGTPGYIESQIDQAVEEGPQKASMQTTHPNPDGRERDTKSLYEIWYFYGAVGSEDLEAAGCQCAEGAPKINAVVTMVNNHVIKAILNPLDTGDFPYDVMVWQKRSGFWSGIGVSRQIRTCQRIVNAAARNMMDNAGRAGGPQLVIKQGVVVPHDGIYELSPWKIWLAGDDADLENLDNAFRFVKVDMLQAELMQIVQWGMKLAEDVTGLPLLLQGQQGKAPDTLGGMQMLSNNASTVLRRIAKLYDDRITEPHVRRYYAYLLQYGDDAEKGQFTIDARGSSALVERDLQHQSILQMGQLVANPIYGLDPKRWAIEYLKSQHLDPASFTYEDAQWQQIVANLASGKMNAAVAVAQLRAQTETQLKQLELQFKQQENAKDRQLQLINDQINERIEEMKVQGAQEINFEELKAMLAQTTLKLRTQENLSTMNTMADLHKHHNPVPQLSPPQYQPTMPPPVQAPGRAAPGQAFTQAE